VAGNSAFAAVVRGCADGFGATGFAGPVVTVGFGETAFG
jgi:hypothetical protein